MGARIFAGISMLATAGCLGPHSGSTASGGGDTGDPVMVDLTVAGLEDVNASSPSFGETLHPNDFTGAATAWYFGHST